MSDVTQNEAKSALEELKKAVEEQRKVYEAKLEAVAKQRSGAEFEEKIDRIGDVIAKQEKLARDFRRQQEEAEAKKLAELAEMKAMQEERERKFEARMNRLALGLGGTAEDATDVDARIQRKAYFNFLRKGVEKMAPDEVKVLVASNDTTGGYLAVPSFAADIIKAEVLFSPMRNLVTVRQIGSGEFQQPKRTQTAAATRQGEIATRAETTNPAWGLVKISAPEMYAEARVSWANLEDAAFDLEGLLRDEFAEQFGVTEGKEIISGTGVGGCQGFLDSSAGLSYTASGGSSTIAGAAGSEGNGIVNLFHAVKTAYARNGSWVLNRASLGKVRLLKDTTGQYLWQPGLQPSNPATILGAPYVECPDMPDEGTNAFPIAFGDWKRAYTLVERVDIVIVRDPYTVAANGQVKFFARRRVGGQVVLSEAVRVLKCATS